MTSDGRRVTAAACSDQRNRLGDELIVDVDRVEAVPDDRPYVDLPGEHSRRPQIGHLVDVEVRMDLEPVQADDREQGQEGEDRRHLQARRRRIGRALRPPRERRRPTTPA